MPSDTDPTGLPPGQSQAATPQEGQQGEPSPQQPTAEALQQQLEQAKREAQETRERAAQIEEGYKHLQADYTRKSQALAQLSGAPLPQQQVDPVSRHIAALKAKGYKEEDLRPVLETSAQLTQEMIREQLAPFQQQLAATQAYGQVGSAMQQAAQNPQVAQLFSDPQISDYVQRILAENARQHGVPPDPVTAQNLAYMAYGQRSMNPPQQQAQQAQQVQQPAPYGVPQFPGTTFPGSGFTTRPAAQQAAAPLTPAQQALEAEMKILMGGKK